MYILACFLLLSFSSLIKTCIHIKTCGNHQAIIYYYYYSYVNVYSNHYFIGSQCCGVCVCVCVCVCVGLSFPTKDSIHVAQLCIVNKVSSTLISYSMQLKNAFDCFTRLPLDLSSSQTGSLHTNYDTFNSSTCNAHAVQLQIHPAG